MSQATVVLMINPDKTALTKKIIEVTHQNGDYTWAPAYQIDGSLEEIRAAIHKDVDKLIDFCVKEGGYN